MNAKVTALVQLEIDARRIPSEPAYSAVFSALELERMGPIGRAARIDWCIAYLESMV